MPVKLIFAPEAEQDISEAYSWYEARRFGLGEEFLSCVDAGIQKIRRGPELYPVVYEEYRRVLLSALCTRVPYLPPVCRFGGFAPESELIE